MKRFTCFVAIFLVTSLFGQTNRWLQGRLVTEKENVKIPVENTIVTVIETGDRDKTDQNGKYRIKLKESFLPGENISFAVEKEGWAILYPLNGEIFIPKILEKELIDILILPTQSKKFLSHDHL